MKKIFLMLIATMALTLSLTEGNAATPKAKKEVATTTFLADITCEGCVKKVMNYLPTQKGVKDVVVDLPKHTISVSYDSSKSSDEAVIKSLSKIGINAKNYAEGLTLSDVMTSSSCK